MKKNITFDDKAGERAREYMRKMRNFIPRKLSDIHFRFVIFVLTVAVVAVASLVIPKFFTADNLFNIFRQMSFIMIIACGAQLLMIGGMIDLSAGSVAGLAGCTGILVYLRTNSIFLAIAVALAVGALAGLIMGAAITLFDLPPFMLTLSMSAVARGIVLVMNNGKSTGFRGPLSFLGQGYIGPVPFSVIVMAGVIALVSFLLNKTRFGRYLYAVGSNERATVSCGIDTGGVKRGAFLINGLLVGLSGILAMARLGAVQPTLGEGYELEAITMVIVGGTSMKGGSGNISGTLLGGIFIAVLGNLMNLNGMSSYYPQILRGLIIAGALILDTLIKRMQHKASKE